MNPEVQYETVTITTRRLDTKGSVQFFSELDQALKQGYEFFNSGLLKDVPRLGGIPRVVLRRPKSAVEDPTEALEGLSEENSPSTPSVEASTEAPESLEAPVEASVALEDMSKKDELLAYAEEHSIEIPSNLKQPAAIKKFLQEYNQAE